MIRRANERKGWQNLGQGRKGMGKAFANIARNRVEVEHAPSEYDLDIEQAEARYDPRLLSQELLGSHSPPKQAAEECVSSDKRYEHGEKIFSRLKSDTKSPGAYLPSGEGTWWEVEWWQ
ncbi:hypothetical protein DMENIID0001_131890 [Sergentomyia squamirostris]